MLNRKGTKDEAGFTLLELIVAISIMVILTGVLAPTVSGQIQKAREARYIEEAHMVYDAICHYVLDEAEAGRYQDIVGIAEKLSGGVDQESHVLYPYLQGTTTKNGSVISASLNSGTNIIYECSYDVGGYRIEVYANGTHRVIKRP